MLEELRIQNFQGHAKFRVVLDPHITTIIGDTDAGKSAIIRALRWVATNQPGGDAFVRYGTKGTTVRIVVDGRTVTRRRKVGGSVNTYHLDDAEYKAFGRGVPDTIESFLNLPEVCWQGQHDPSFWFGETAGEVSRQLNAIVDLGIIDTTLTNASRLFTKARHRLDAAEEELTAAKAAKDESEWAVDCDEDLLGVERAFGDSYTASGLAVRCRGLVEAATTHRATKKRHRARHGALSEVVSMAAKARAAFWRAVALRDAIQVVEETSVVAGAALPNFKPVADAARTAVVARNRAEKLKTLVGDIEALKKTLCQHEKNHRNALKEIPDACPTCGQSSQATST